MRDPRARVVCDASFFTSLGGVGDLSSFLSSMLGSLLGFVLGFSACSGFGLLTLDGWRQAVGCIERVLIITFCKAVYFPGLGPDLPRKAL